MSGEHPGPRAMSDDTREREPLRDRADNPAEAGTRSDHAGTGAASSGVAPGGQATSAGGGYGVGSERGSGGTGEGTQPAGDDSETEWLRDASGGPAGGSSGG
jgi:hypothetical protein